MNGTDYSIIFEKANSDVAPVVDNSVAKTITVQKNTIPTTTLDMQTVLSNIKIGGTNASPKYDDASGSALDCSSIDFDAVTTVGNCEDFAFPTI